MQKAIIMTDSNTEIPYQWVDEYNIPFVPMNYIIKDQEYFYDLGRNTDLHDFFEQMRKGMMPLTSMYNPQYYIDFWRPMLQAGNDIIFICFSSGLSGTFEMIQQPRLQMLEEFPDRKITLIDTLNISMGAGILVLKALQMRHAGASDEEIISWLEENKHRVNIWFSVDDMMHLKRGGRISAAAAVMGTILDIKPILTVNANGKLVPIEKIVGKKKTLKRMCEILKERIEHPEQQEIWIIHGDAPQTAQFLADQLAAAGLPFQAIHQKMVGPVLGTHAGPGVIGLIFMGKDRTDISAE